jgi:hypothetical protein
MAHSAADLIWGIASVTRHGNYIGHERNAHSPYDPYALLVRTSEEVAAPIFQLPPRASGRSPPARAGELHQPRRDGEQARSTKVDPETATAISV